MEKKYDYQFKVVFDTIKQLLEPPQIKERREDRERQEKTGAVEEKAEETIRTARAAEKGGQRPRNSA